ncbi:protein kinase domain-containing protein [Pseudomarimonas arenosa]|uniref:Protein kinase n=1 Tax=Pseudomarimonas arenosa TaxID=2774145 RepID=A0AAW3ZSR0_9GAMM|nr:protein kinase [Pseudomarimonas arenosa]MBD8528054.1 protein kinase [Pseudomarimonas arenosa]
MPSPSVVEQRSVLITDLVDSTRLLAELGDARAHELQLQHDRRARDLLAEHHGQEIDKSDGFLLLFARAADAVLFALHYHRLLREFSAECGVQWRARVGIHQGELFLHPNEQADIARGAKPLEVDGMAKPVAARLMSLAQGGQTLLSRRAFDAARRAGTDLSELSPAWVAHGCYRLKGMDEPIEVFEVGVPGQAPLNRPPDSDKAVREVSDEEALLLGWRPGPGLPVPERPQWRLVKKLGSGGFGEVWLIEHGQSRDRRVLKFCHDAEHLRSLKREVTVFRLIKEAIGDRRDIAQIFDWQLNQSPFYLEIEYVEGGDLLSYAEAAGGLQAIPLQRRIELVAQVADALGAAHSVGVLHKDIKPANVLIRGGETPQAVLTDFGIGLITDRGQLLARGITMAGFTEALHASPTAGTQLYMAPELLEGKAASMQADLYALGVMLYELAAGQFKALAPGWQRDIQDELLAADIASLVDGDPMRRPTSAARVAHDLRALPERHRRLAAKRQAESEAKANRVALIKAQRRKRWALGLSGSLILVLALVGYAAKQAMDARREAEARRDQAEQLISFMLNDLRGKLSKLGRLDVLDGVGDAAKNYFATVDASSLTPNELLSRVKALYQLGEVMAQQGRYPQAAEAMAESLKLANQLHALDPREPSYAFEKAQAEFWSGYVAWQRGDVAEATPFFQAYERTAQRMLDAGLGSRDTWTREQGYAWSNLGSLYEQLGDLDAASDYYTRYLHLLEQRQDSSPAHLRMLANANNKLGYLAEKSGQYQRAAQLYAAEFAIAQGLSESESDNALNQQRFAKAAGFHCRGLWFSGQPVEAIDACRVSHSISRGLALNDPQNLPKWNDYVTACKRLVSLLAEQQETQRGAAVLQQCSEELDAANIEPASERVGLQLPLESTAQILFPEQANPRLHALLREQTIDDKHAPARLLAQTLWELTLGDQASAQGNSAAAERHWRDALRVIDGQHGLDFSLLRARLWNRLGQRKQATALLSSLLSAGVSERILPREVGLPPLL